MFDLEYWKATEFRQFLLYSGPLVLKGVVEKKVYQHFFTLHVALSILLNDDHDAINFYLKYAKDLLGYFVRMCRIVSSYGK